ncbi:hypothetical protein N9917_02060, partial [Deltaproteobacteria bacterium]|nr:hypothetical protein [Deltaproteobacteria bacterium]
QETKEEAANPYNMNKGYDIEDEQVFESADGVYYDKPKKKATRKATPSDDNYKKRYDDLKKHYDNKVNQFKQKEKELQAQSRMQQRVEQKAAAQPAKRTPVTRKSTPTLQQREAKVARKEAEMSLQQAHPDFAQVRESTEFHSWAKSQPKVIQDWVYNNPNNVSLAVKAIDIYKSETGKTSSRTTGGSQSRPSGSAADMVSTKTRTVDAGEPRVWSQREIASLSMDQYDKYEAEIDLAMSEGRVVG